MASEQPDKMLLHLPGMMVGPTQFSAEIFFANFKDVQMLGLITRSRGSVDLSKQYM